MLKNARQLGCVLQDTERLESSSILRRSTKVLGSMRRVRFATATQRHANIRENKGPSLGQIQVKVPHQRRPYSLKFEDRSQEETERGGAMCPRRRGEIGQKYLKLKEKDKATFLSPTNIWCLPAPPVIKPEERESVVDSGASMHLLRRKDLNSAELETVRVSQSQTTVVTANGEVQTKEEATVYVRELDLFETVMLLENTLAVLSLGKLCEDHGYSYEWTGGQKPQLRIKCSTEHIVPIVVLVYRQVFQAQLHLHLQHQYHRKQ